jgi:FdhD protein
MASDPVHEDVTTRLEVLRWRDGKASREEDVLAVERRVTFHVEPLGVLDVQMTPDGLEDFIVGHLVAEGIVGTARDVLSTTVAHRVDRTEVLVEVDPSGLMLEAPGEGIDGAGAGRALGLIRTGCAGAPDASARPLRPIEGRLGMRAGELARIPSAARDLAPLYTRTGAVHYAHLVDAGGAPLMSAHDVGRHTAVDKAIGRALRAGERLRERALFTTGRLSSDVVRKCVRASLPLVASRGAALSAAVDIARANALCTVGFLRGGRFNVYSGEHHIVWD